MNWQEAASLEDFADLFTEQFPPIVTAKAMLGDRYPEFRERLVEIWRDANEAKDGSFHMPQEYLLSVIRI